MAASNNIVQLNLTEAKRDIAVKLIEEFYEISDIKDRQARQIRFVQWDNKASSHRTRFSRP